MAALMAASGSASEGADDATESADGDGASTTLEGQTISKRPAFFGDGTVFSWVSSLFRRNGNGTEEVSNRE